MTLKSLFKAGLLATASLVASAVPAAADPISIALLSTVGFAPSAIGGGLLAATTAGLQVLAGTAVSLGLNFLSTTLSEKPRGLGGSRTQVQIGADLPRQVIFGRGAIGGSPIYLSGRGKKNTFLTIVFRLADWECDSLENVWIEGDRRNLTSVPVVGTEHARYLVGGTTNKIVIRFFRGTMTQAADSELIADEAGSNGTRIGSWTANHRLAGICYASVRVEYGTENMPSVPSIVFGVKGAKLYDWRKDSTNGGSGAHRWSDPATWEWSDNPAVCDYNFRRGFYRNGIRVLGMGVPSSDLLLDHYTAAANVCDETITEGGETERRYRVGVVVPDDAEWRVAIDAFRASMAGEVVERAGTFGVIAGGAYAPVMTITDDDMRADAPSSFSRKAPRSELYNSVAVTWANPRIRYESDTLTPLTNSTYEAEDNLERIVKPVDLSMVYKPYQARRIGRIILEQSRMQATHVGVYPAKFSALEPGDWVTRTFNRDGLGSVTMKVVSIREVEPEWYEITLRQADSTNFTAPTGTITIVDPPTIVEAPVLPDAPSTLTLGETVNINNDGTAISTVTATWAAGENAATYVLAVKQGASEIEYGTGSALTFSFRAVVGVAYQVRVRSVDTDGLKSDWTSYGTITPTGDITPPGPPSGLTATGLFTSILLEWTNPTDKDFAAVQVWEATSNNFASATKVATVSNTIWARDGLAANFTRYYWLTAIDRTGNVSTKFPASDTAGVSATTVALGSSDFPAGLKPVEIVNSLPTTGNFQGRVVFLTTDNKLYRYDGSAFVATVPTADLTGQVTAGQIADAAITTAKFASGIEPVEILSALPTTGNFQGRVVFLTIDNKLYRYNGTAFVSTVPAADLTGQVTASQIADAAITTAKFASGIEPVEILSALPTTGNFQGRVVFLTTDNKLYRYNGTAFVSTVPTTDLTGQVTSTQITDNSVTTAKIAANAVTANEIAANSVVAGKIAAAAVSTAELAAGAVTAAKIAAGTITANEIAANTITGGKIASDTITAANIAANAITASELAADSVVAGKIAAAAVSTAELAAGAVTAAKIAAGTITANEIAANTITGGKIASDTITAANIAANAITASELAANSVTAGKIAAGAVAADQIAANAVTAAKILAGSVTAEKLSVSTLSAISANVGTVTAGLIRSGASGMVLDLNNNRIQSGGFSADALTGFQLDGTTGTLTANSVTIAGGTSAKRPFEFAFGAVQDGILSDEGTANVYFPLSATNNIATVFGTVRRTPTETIYNLEATVDPDYYAGKGLAPEVTSGAITGGYPRAKGITCAPASALIFTGNDSSDNEFMNGYLVVTQTGQIVLNMVGTGPGALGNAMLDRKTVGYLYNDADADPLFLETYAQTTVHVWKNVFTGGIRRIRVPDTVTVSGSATPVTGMRVWMWGAAGQEGSGRQGGPGGYVKFDHAVTAGEMLSLLVGGFNGNGWGGVSSNYVSGSGQRALTSFASQGGGGSFLWRGPALRTTLLGVAGGGGSGGRLRNGGCGGSTAFGGGNGTSGTTMARCVGITSLGDFVIVDDSRGSSSGGGGYIGGGRLGTGNPDNEGGRGGTNYIISTATSTTSSASAEDANGAATGTTPPGTSQSVYVSGVGTASPDEGAAGGGMICIQWLT